MATKTPALPALIRQNQTAYSTSSVHKRVITSHRNKQDLTAQQTKTLLM